MGSKAVVVWADKSFVPAARKLSRHQREIRTYADDLAGRCVLRKCTSTAEAARAVAEGAGSLLAVVSNMRRAESATAGLDLHSAVQNQAPHFVLFTTTATPPPEGSACGFTTVAAVAELDALLIRLGVPQGSSVSA